MINDYAKLNRKDKDPKLTVEYILELLNSYNIMTLIEDERNYHNKWFSIRLSEVNNLPFSSNGKGISREFAMASAYAEFMERIQGQFIPKEVLSKNTSNKIKSEYINKFIPRNNNHFSYNKKIEEMLIEDSELCQMIEYYNLTNDVIEELPEWFISKLCSSNGLCAGNTFEEAIVQGVCEILERYVKRYLFLKETEVPTIPNGIFEGLYSYELIKEMERKGFICMIKDCTLGGKYPVLGLVVLNKNMNKVIFTLGSDLDIDICIQRCITEMFQGRNLDEDLEKSMSDIGYNTIFQGNINDDSKKIMLRTIVDNIGPCPVNFLDSKNKNIIQYKKAFLDKGFNNTEAFVYLINLLKKEDRNIYIRDHSYLGFNTYRIYIPNMSEVKDINNVISFHENQKVIKSLLYNIDKLSSKELKKLCNIIEITRNIDLIYITGAIRNCIPQTEEIDMFEDNKFLSLIYAYIEDYEKAYFYMLSYIRKNNKAYSKNVSIYTSILIYLNGKMNGIEEDILNNIMNFYKSENNEFLHMLYSKNLSFILEKLPKCPQCNTCNIESNCKVNIKNISNKVDELYVKCKNYSQDKMIQYINKIY